ncbi:TetR/AcrR family transcriptional regulator C-terminal domain-containing protein [Microbacterium yannicii]|uniref:TetR/AcrR family transcriptional regulator C-terminal domain-containing protein n=1 Tax=Microbacterium yannicii TaxID=671622 RepID=UPI0003089E51|nr:TetR/AcrR family transcriptional regulator C-terminal domain-containing protein [Microbacterium yannicii]
MTRAGAGRGHSRDDVAREALRILDEYGLPDLTMRRLAAALEVQPSALYWHFPSKQSLLAELSDRIVAPAPAPASAGSDWGSHLTTQAFALREALLSHRDGAEVVASTIALGLGATAARDRLSQAIAIGGFDDLTVRRATTTLLHFVLGHVSHEQQKMQFDSLGIRGSDSADPSKDTAEAEFAFGVGLLVTGLRESLTAAGS